MPHAENIPKLDQVQIAEPAFQRQALILAVELGF